MVTEWFFEKLDDSNWQFAGLAVIEVVVFAVIAAVTTDWSFWPVAASGGVSFILTIALCLVALFLLGDLLEERIWTTGIGIVVWCGLVVLLKTTTGWHWAITAISAPAMTVVYVILGAINCIVLMPENEDKRPL